MRNWKAYIEKTKDKKPSHLLTKAMAYVKRFDHAIDIGAGAMADTRYLQAQGFTHIDAVDIEPTAAERAPEGVNVHIASYEQFPFPQDKYDLVNAQYALPFAGMHLKDVMEKIQGSIKREGVFVGTFFGPHDAWASDADVTAVSRKWVEEFFSASEWKMHVLEEEEADRPTAAGTEKHWHVFNVIASRI
jgi:tellurite methyltransferase